MINDFLTTGIIERYCLNEISEQERAIVNQWALKYREIDEEIAKCKKNLVSKSVITTPSLSNVKYKLMRRVYQNCALTNPNFLPLFEPQNSKVDINSFLKANNLDPQKNFEGDMDMQPLASTVEIENAAVWIKGDFAEEIHDNEVEFIYVVEGSCVMSLNGIPKSYSAGELIYIPPKISHAATVTSSTPMFALVQRQLLAQA